MPCVEAGLASLSPDTVADWGCGLATSCRHRHPATLAPLLQALTSHLLTGTTTSFREAARLYVLQVRFVFHFVLLFVSTLFLLPLAKWVASSCYMGERGPAPTCSAPCHTSWARTGRRRTPSWPGTAASPWPGW